MKQKPIPTSLRTNILEILNKFKSISLPEIEGFALMERVDTKYVFHADNLGDFLALIKDDYDVLEVNSSKISRYESLYFDTEDFSLYHFHQRGKFNRFKFRIRKYLETKNSFFEIKFKSNKGRTYKNRILHDSLNSEASKEINEFMLGNSKYKFSDLEEKIWVNYSRITLINKKFSERVTLDLNLTFIHKEQKILLENYIVAEVKQEKSSKSPFGHLMHKYHIREGSISKYCMGVMNLFPEIKSNNFKPFQINLKKIKTIQINHV